MNKMNWKTKEKELKVLIANGLSNHDIAKMYGTTYDAVQSALKRLDIQRGVIKEDSPVTNKQVSQNVNQIIHTLQEELRKVTPCKKRVVENMTHQGDTLVVHITDWHVGRIIKDEMGQTVYDEKVFEQRINTLQQEMLGLLDRYIRKGTPIKDVAILSTGDIVDGQGIFATQETLQELSPPFQVMTAAKTIQSFILALLERNLNVYFYGVKGNHGEIRVGGKNRDPNANWDFMLYLILDYWSKAVLRNKKVSINYSELDYLNFEIQGWKYHIRHIAPCQSETSGGKAKFLGWAKKHGFNALVYGHFHHWGVWDRSGITVFRGGSIPGGDEFAETLAEQSDPTQCIWGCNPKRPLTFFYPVDLGRKGLK